MKLRSIETTPNPNCMMLKVDEDFGDRSVTLQASDPNLDQAPQQVRALLAPVPARRDHECSARLRRG
jgi:hypothetical protein